MHNTIYTPLISAASLALSLLLARSLSVYTYICACENNACIHLSARGIEMARLLWAYKATSTTRHWRVCAPCGTGKVMISIDICLSIGVHVRPSSGVSECAPRALTHKLRLAPMSLAVALAHAHARVHNTRVQTQKHAHTHIRHNMRRPRAVHVYKTDINASYLCSHSLRSKIEFSNKTYIINVYALARANSHAINTITSANKNEHISSVR